MFECSAENGFRKSEIYDREKNDLLEKITRLESEIENLKQELKDGKERLEEVEVREQEEALRMKAQRKERCARIHRANLQLKRQIEGILFKER